MILLPMHFLFLGVLLPMIRQGVQPQGQLNAVGTRPENTNSPHESNSGGSAPIAKHIIHVFANLGNKKVLTKQFTLLDSASRLAFRHRAGYNTYDLLNATAVAHCRWCEGPKCEYTPYSL